MAISKCCPRRLLPVEAGRQLVPTAIDEIAEKDPNRVFAEFIDSPLTPGGVQKLDFKTFARAIDRTAWWMKSELGVLQLPENSVVAYAGYPDARYYLILVAAIKCGYSVFFPSITNDLKASLRLLRETRSAALLFTTQDPSAGSVSARASCGLPCLQVPEMDELMNETPVTRFPYLKTYAEGASDPVLILHTSGSTGFPKPVRWTNAHLVCMAFMKPSSPSETPGPTTQSERMRVFTSSAIYHVGGMLILSTAIYLNITAVLPPLHIPTLQITASELESWLSMASCDIATLFPSQLSLAQDSSSLLDEICKLKLVSYIGAPLPPRIADLLRKRVHLVTEFGSTELVRVRGQPTDPEDHQYIHVKVSQTGIQWRETLPGRYEMVHVRATPGQAENELLQPQYIFMTYPDLQEYSSGDLFSKHPTKPDHWKYEGRTDDSVVLSIGQNVIPKAYEERLERHAAVRSATVLGNDRPCVCLLLELEPEKDRRDGTPGEMLDQEIWPAIQRASEGMRTYEQVQRSMIVLARPEKPIPRNFKGAVKRGEAWELYQTEIEACYARLSDSSASNTKTC